MRTVAVFPKRNVKNQTEKILIDFQIYLQNSSVRLMYISNIFNKSSSLKIRFMKLEQFEKKSRHVVALQLT